MAIKSICYFTIGFVGDGSATSKQVNFTTAPFVLSGGIYPTGSTHQFSPGFNLNSLLPTAVSGLSSSDSQEVTASLGLLGAVTFTWPEAIPDNEIVNVYGVLEF